MVVIPATILGEMIEHLRKGFPDEACGLLGGKDGKVWLHQPTTNIEPENKKIRYLIEPREQLHFEEELDRQDLELVGIYHSHTHTPARPSPTDVRTAYYPDTYYILVSLTDYDHPDVRAYKIVKPDPWGETGEIVEQELKIISEAV